MVCSSETYLNNEVQSLTSPETSRFNIFLTSIPIISLFGTYCRKIAAEWPTFQLLTLHPLNILDDISSSLHKVS